MIHSDNRKLFLIGLDCAEPDLIFNKWRDRLPAFRFIMKKGIYAHLESTIPAITVPAWVSMVTGKDPGELGIYGFRNRKAYDYSELFIPNSSDIKDKAVWEYLDLYNKRSFIMGVPMTYPVKRINGIMISGFMAPDTESEYTYPCGFKNDIRKIIGDYIIDVKDFRTSDKDRLQKQIMHMTNKRFQLFLKVNRMFRFDFAMMVEMGTDRMHHGFWKYMAEDHPGYEKGNPYENAIFNYYRLIDDYLGQIMEEYGDRADIMIVSDHGAKTMKGGFNINQWLMDKGYLVLKKGAKSLKKFTNCDIDWDMTRAWGSGGYYSRIFFNVRGREPAGVIDGDKYDEFLHRLKQELEDIRHPDGNPLGNRCFIPSDIYRKINNVPPDLILYPANLEYRAIGSIGHNSFFSTENDTGPDDANHSQNGIFMYHGDNTEKKGYIGKWSICDIASTVVKFFRISSHSSKAANILSDARSRNVFFREQ